jgi:cysteinyl-tRNA synthetase
MDSKFDKIYEGFLPTTLKVVTRTRYPKQIQFSDDFLNHLKEEYARLEKTVTENEEEGGEVAPIKNYKEKFLKALNFCIHTL